MTNVITVKDARSKGVSAAALNSVAAWNEENIEKAQTQAQKERRALQASQLRKVANALA